MRFWLGAVVLIGGFIFAFSVSDVMTGSHHIDGDAWVGVIVPPAMALFGIALPRVGRLLARDDEPFILDFLQTTLAARIDAPSHFPPLGKTQG